MNLVLPIDHGSYVIERRYLVALLRMRNCGHVFSEDDAGMRYAAIYVIGWGC